MKLLRYIKEMVRIAFLDLETTGLPKTISFNEYYSYTQTRHYDRSRIVQIGMVIVDYENDESKVVAEHDYIIRPNGFQIANSHIHGITQAIAEEKGIGFIPAMDKIQNDLIGCDVLIAHNIIFDKNVLLSELHRYGLSELVYKVNMMKEFCTSKGCTDVTKIRYNMLEFKQPKLIELYKFLFKKEPANLHNAINDVKAMVECFNELLKRKILMMDKKGNVEMNPELCM